METNKGDTNSEKRNTSYGCPHYEALPDDKRCRNYLAGGPCARPDEFMCVEWLKQNNKSAAMVEELESVPNKKQYTDLFGNPLPKPKKPRRTKAQKHLSLVETLPELEVEDTDTEDEFVGVDQLPGFTDEDIASFKALGVEVCLKSEAFGQVWLVGEYTGQDRKEITPEHVATISRTMAAFPGSEVVSFEQNKNQDKEDE